LVVAAEFVFAGALGGFSAGGGLLSDWRWQLTRTVAAKATAARYAILFFMVYWQWPPIGASLSDAALGRPAGFELRFSWMLQFENE
jgi:hypothetical protein